LVDNFAFEAFKPASEKRDSIASSKGKRLAMVESEVDQVEEKDTTQGAEEDLTEK